MGGQKPYAKAHHYHIAQKSVIQRKSLKQPEEGVEIRSIYWGIKIPDFSLKTMQTEDNGASPLN